MALVVFLIGFDVAARLLWHVPNVSPVAASALFAGMMLRRRSLALVVPLAALLIGDAIMGFYHWQVMAVVYAALTLPAVAGILTRHVRASRVVVPTVLACSLIFFVTTNFAVWAWSGLYSADMAGLIQCYVDGPAVPEIHHRRRSVLGRGAVRRRLAGAAPDRADARARS